MTDQTAFKPSAHCSTCGHQTMGTHQSGSVRPRVPLRGLGYLTLVAIVGAFLAVNSSQLWAMSNELATKEQAAEEAKKPVEVETIALISPNCAACYNVTSLLANLDADQKVKITKTRTIEIGSSEGVALVNQYKLTRSPSFIIRGQTAKLLAAVPGLKSYGQLQNDVFVGSTIPAPYMDLLAGKLRGTFEATYITEKSCLQCYDPTLHRQSMAQLGMTPTTEKTVDRTDPDGKKLIKQYALTSTPTVILTGDLAAYVGFDDIWKSIGTIEGDGAYVFRTAQDRMGTYYDLTTKKVIAPPPANTNTNTTTP